MILFIPVALTEAFGVSEGLQKIKNKKLIKKVLTTTATQDIISFVTKQCT